MKFLKSLKKLPKKYLYLGVILVSLAGGFFFFSNRNKKEPIQFVSVKKQSIQSTVSTSGVLAGKNTANLKFRSSGKLAYINVKVGDQVQSGQTIAGLDTQDLAITLQQAQNTLRDKQAIVDKIYDDLKNHSTDETLAQRQTRTTTEVARDNAYDTLKAAQRDFQDSVIISPISGTVTQVNFVSGQSISTSDIISQVVDFSEVFFDADIDEADIGKITVGQKAQVSLNAYEGKVLTGNTNQLLPQTKTTSSGATVVTTRIKLDNPNINLIPNLNGQVNIITSEKDNALTIPLEALANDHTVLVRNQQGFRKTKVTEGIRSDTDVEILSGLKEGDTVIKNPSSVNLQRQGNNPFFRLGRVFSFSFRR